jgi:hypothetical protein
MKTNEQRQQELAQIETDIRAFIKTLPHRNANQIFKIATTLETLANEIRNGNENENPFK